MTEDRKSKREKDQDLDDELEDSFPASDPPSSSIPATGPGAPDHDDRKQRRSRPLDRPADPGRLRPGSGGMPVRGA